MNSKETALLLLRYLSLQLLLLAFGLSAFAQTADLSGVVTDSSYAAIPGASITVMKESTRLKRTASSNEQGFYRLPFLRPGSYMVTVETAGFEAVRRSGLKLDAGQEARLDFTLVPAGLKQSVTVRGSASSLQTESSSVATEVDPQLVQDLPLNGRTFQSLIALAPGVVGISTVQRISGGGQFSVNGQRDTANYFTVDGVSANVGIGNLISLGPAAGGTAPAFTALGTTHNLVSLDAMQEFRLQTSTTSAEFGRAAGGQVQIVTRSGTNDFYGTVFDYFRNEALDANDWFANAKGLPRAPLRLNDFGGVFGGPILKNRTFFFASYEGLRLRLPGVGTILVPSLSARQAATGAIQQVFDAFPLPNGPEDPATMLAQFTGNTFSSLTSSDNTSIRIDHMVNQRLFLFGRYSEAPSNGNAGTFDVGSTSANFRSVTLGATLVLSPKATSDLRLNYSRNEADGSFHLLPVSGAIPPPDSLLFPAPFASPSTSRFTVFVGPHFDAGRLADNLQRQGNLVSNTSVLQGPHEVRFGVDHRYLAPHYGPFGYRQVIRFSGVPGALTGVARQAVILSFDSVTLGFHNLSLYAQDNWKVNRRLTLIYGLRWEFGPPPHAKGNQPLLTVTGFPDLASLQLAPPGTPVYQTTYTNFAPRFGAAYQLLQHPGRETVIRAGFGIYYDLGVGSIGDAAVSFPHLRVKPTRNAPYPLTAEVAAPPPPPSLDPPFSGSFNVFAPGHRLPRTYQWNFTIDQRLGAGQMLSASYVGEVGRKLLRQNFLGGPNPTFAGSQINIASNTSSSDYHALQIQFQRRIAHGLAALLSYTWSHSLDDTSTDIGNDTLADPRLDRGPSDFDVRHTFNTALTYNIPAPSRKPALRAVLGNWSMDGIFTASTALPVNVFVDEDLLFDSSLITARPDRIPGVPLYLYDPTLPGGRRINPDAFSVPVEERQGSLGRNALRGLPATQLDFALRRQFNITEKIKLQGRADFFNLLNHPNFVVDSDLGSYGPPLYPSPTFGEAVLTLANAGDLTPLFHVGGPRSIQLSLRLRF